MRAIKRPIPLIILLLLVGCNSDSNNETATIPNPDNENLLTNGPENPNWKYINNGYMPLEGKSAIKGEIQVYLGRRANTVDSWIYACTGKNAMKTDDQGNTVQVYPQDPNGNLIPRLTKQLGHEPTAAELTEYPSSDCFTLNLPAIYLDTNNDGVDEQFPWVLKYSEVDSVKDETQEKGNITIADAAFHNIKTHSPNVAGNYPPTDFKVNVEKWKNWIENVGDELGKGTSRPDIYQPGYYNVFDLLRYVNYIRADLNMNISAVPYNFAGNSYPLSQYDTYEFTIDWDVNGDGVFDENDNHFITADIDRRALTVAKENAEKLGLPESEVNYPAYFESDRWNYVYWNSVGNERANRGELNSYTYQRMDRLMVREDSTWRFFPEFPVVTERRHAAWKHELEFFQENGGKINVPMEEAYPKNNRNESFTKLGKFYYQDINDYQNGAPITLFINDSEGLEVRASNLRTDMFKPGVMTIMDHFLSNNRHIEDNDGKFLYIDQETPLFKFGFWPIMSSGAIVNQFSIEETPKFGVFGGDNAARAALYTYGFQMTANDYGSGVVDCNHFDLHGQPRTVGDDKTPYLDDVSCIINFKSNTTGGYTIQEPTSSHQVPYGFEFMRLIPYPKARDSFANHPSYADKFDSKNFNFNNSKQTIANSKSLTLNSVPDDNIYLHTIEIATKENTVGNATVLDESHPGWKIADCTLCHNAQKDPKGHKGSVWPTNPEFDASGDPVQQPYYCASCHGNNGAPKSHGRTQSCYWCHSVKGDNAPSNHGESTALKWLEANDHVSNLWQTSRAPGHLGNYEKYQSKFVQMNNFEDRSKSWPDPWACGTCHIDEEKENLIPTN